MPGVYNIGMRFVSPADDLLRAAGGLSRWASAQAALGVPSGQLRLLASIEEREPIRVGDLAEVDHTSQPAVTRQVGRLEALGWAERTADPDDARASLVSLTTEGMVALTAARQARGEVLARVIAEAQVDADEVRRAAELLDHLLTAARRVAEKA